MKLLSISIHLTISSIQWCFTFCDCESSRPATHDATRRVAYKKIPENNYHQQWIYSEYIV